MLPLLLKDGYKTDHRRQYPDGTTLVYSNFTPRESRREQVKRVVMFGMQYFCQKYLIDEFRDHFFQCDEQYVLDTYKRVMDAYLGKDSVTVEHVRDLHRMGSLPLIVKAVPEGTQVPLRIPMATWYNTHPDAYWLTNMLETVLSNILWKPCTSATTALLYRKRFEAYAQKTGADPDFVKFQGHDFSYRGMSGTEDAQTSGAAHLTSFVGTDTIPALDLLENYYDADITKELVGCSVPATEHSVMCMGGEDDEVETIRRLITKIYPEGIVSVVSDTWDYWQLLTKFLPQLKSEIMGRNGKLVIRPDSGDPVKIICGDAKAVKGSAEYKGSIRILAEQFGTTTSSEGHRILDQHIGLIYGDSITPERQLEILHNLRCMGFCSSNVVLGIGSYTYQYVTRDTYGFAAKATYGEVAGSPRIIFKKPKTDNGVKNSAKGLLRVDEDEHGDLVLRENVSWEQEKGGLLGEVFNNGRLVRRTTLREIRERMHGKLW